MRPNNKFFIFKEQNIYILPRRTYNLQTGESIEQDGTSAILKHVVSKANKIEIKCSLYNSGITVLMWNSKNTYLGYDIISNEPTENVDFSYEVSQDVNSIAVIFNGTDISYNKSETENIGYEVNPHYKKLEKKYKKENNQAFFRESLDGKITLWGTDYLLIKNASIEDNMVFRLYRNNNLYATASFNKSDCKFDHFKKSVELGLKYDDRYTKILDAYENTYDLIKLAPALTPLTLTKRSVVQIYIQGENIISNFSGGTYWETDVDEAVDDENALTRKYHFSKGPKYIEVDLTGFNYEINAAYRGLWDSDCWNAVSSIEVLGVKHKLDCCIKFTKIHNAYDEVSADESDILKLSDGVSSAVEEIASPIGSGNYKYICKYDTYRIEIYNGRDGKGTKLYQSNRGYGKDGNFTLAAGNNLYPMTRVQQPVPQKDPTPHTFNLGAFVIEYQIWGRLLCDIDIAPDGNVMQDLPYDDFATARRNYKKCVGLTGFDSDNSVVKIYQNQNTSEKPTPYGMNDFKEYFVAPYSISGQYFYPLSRHSWGNTSMWVMLDELAGGRFEVWASKYYKKYALKNSYHISDVIKSLLAEIDPSITHENSPIYSQFLYGHSGGTANALGGCDIYITQKTNILKGEYDQAAQKAEIKLKQVMDMLRDCFRCYWFIDEQNRLRIEHVSYFIKGHSYGSPGVQIDLTEKYDKFNKLKSLYNQQEVEFDKSDLASRYEFAWMDDVTDSMGNLKVDIHNNYIQKDKTEEINIDGFTSDIDYMLFMPDDFSNDGFALLLANSDKEVPIVWENIESETQYGRQYDVFPQNWYASFNQLIKHYMLDMPGRNISYNNVAKGSLFVTGIKNCLKHEIQFPSNQLNIDIDKLITTEIGDGYIEEMSTDIDTDMTKIELRYEPK